MAEPPIIVNEKGDVELYEGLLEAARDLEPIDVENEEFIVFDSRGLLLIPKVTQDGIRVELEDSSPPDYREDQLVSVLRRSLSRLGEDLTQTPEDEIWRRGLPELISILRAVQARPRRSRLHLWPWKRRAQ